MQTLQTNGTTYRYQISATNSAGEGPKSPDVAATPGDPANVRSCPPFPAFPDESCTGVPPGVVLVPMNSMTITADNTVVDGVLVTGVITVEAHNVVIRRSRLLADPAGRGVINVRSGSVLIEDVEMDGRALQDGVNPGGEAAVGSSTGQGGFTLRRVNIHDFFEGPRLISNTTIEDSYIHHMKRCVLSNGSNCHVDALQTTGGNNINIIHNNIQIYNPIENDLLNAAFQYGTEHAPVTNCTVMNNYVNGGNYTINGRGGGSDDAECVVTGNHFGRNFRYGPQRVSAASTFDSSNVWADTGEPVR